MADVVCSGPGPHDPPSGILGTSDKPASTAVRCASPACAPAPDPALLNAATLRAQAVQALIDNRAFVAVASPSNAQVVAQVKALTRQTNAIIRQVLGFLDGID